MHVIGLRDDGRRPRHLYRAGHVPRRRGRRSSFDGIMGAHGFGIIGNAIIVVCGGVLALYFDATVLRHGTQIEFRNAFISPAARRRPPCCWRWH